MNYYGDDEPYYNPEDLMEEHELVIRDILTEAVNKKIKTTVDELALVKEQLNKLQKENNELRKDLRNTDKLHNEQLKKAIVENTKETERKLSCGFAPHDIVWYIKSNSTQTVCEKCNGHYRIKVDVLGKQKEVDCPHCSYGKVYTYNYYPVKDVVSSVYFNFHRADKNFKDSGVVLNIEKIYLENYDSSIGISSLYKTLEECQVACDKRNLEEKSK